MKKATNDTGWTVDQGLAAQYAAQAGLDPELAASAGNKAWDVLKSMRDAADEADPARRAKLVRRTRRRLKDSGLGGHRDLIKQISTRLDALSWDGPNPSVNPETGLQEFRFECVEGRGGPCETVAEPIDTLVHNFVYTADGTPVRSQPGITNYSPGQFAGSFGAPGGGFPNARERGGLLPPDHFSQSGEISDGYLGQPFPMSEDEDGGDDLRPELGIQSKSLRDILADPSSASNQELETAKQQLMLNGAVTGLTIAGAGLGLGRTGPPVMATAGAGAATWFGLMFGRISNEIDRRKNVGTEPPY